MTLQKSSSSKKIAEIMLSLVTWFAVILQLVITEGSIFNFISYFTILCNLLVAIGLTAKVIAPTSNMGSFFSLITVQTGIALYIFIVGLVYNTVLRGIWEPKGWQLVADNLLHVFVPFFYVMYWIICTPKGTLKWKDGIPWTFFPLVYLIYSLIRGHFVGWYPYPFLNVDEFGYLKVFVNSGFVVIAFLLFGSLLIWIDGSMKKSTTA